MASMRVSKTLDLGSIPSAPARQSDPPCVGRFAWWGSGENLLVRHFVKFLIWQNIADVLISSEAN